MALLFLVRFYVKCSDGLSLRYISVLRSKNNADVHLSNIVGQVGACRVPEACALRIRVLERFNDAVPVEVAADRLGAARADPPTHHVEHEREHRPRARQRHGVKRVLFRQLHCYRLLPFRPESSVMYIKLSCFGRQLWVDSRK